MLTFTLRRIYPRNRLEKRQVYRCSTFNIASYSPCGLVLRHSAYNRLCGPEIFMWIVRAGKLHEIGRCDRTWPRDAVWSGRNRSVGVIGCDRVTPYDLVEIYKRFKGRYCLHRQEITLNVGAVNYSETRANCYHVTWLHVPDDSWFFINTFRVPAICSSLRAPQEIWGLPSLPPTSTPSIRSHFMRILEDHWDNGVGDWASS